MDNSKQMGTQAESRFEQYALQKGCELERSTVRQDMREHWDFLMDGKKVDVKSMKKRKRHDESVDATIVYVEFLNVRGDMGWLYGEADLIAFEQPMGFVLVEREALAKLAEEKVSSQFATRPTLYKSYRRFNRPEEHVGLILMEDVLTLPTTWI